MGRQLEESRQKSRELEDINEKLTSEIQGMLGLSQESVEIELKKGVLGAMLSSSQAEEESPSSSKLLVSVVTVAEETSSGSSVKKL